MLGKLFNLTSGAPAGDNSSAQTPAPKPAASLDSVQEDIHTRNLLFPDANALYQHRNDQVFPLTGGTGPSFASAPGSFDYNNSLELDARDIRVVIMQDALSSYSSCLLFDSQPPPNAWVSSDRRSPIASTARPSPQESRRAPTSPREPTSAQSTRPLVIQPDGSQARQGISDRRCSVHSRGPSYVDLEPLRPSREYHEEIGTFTSCIFGNSELMAYKGTSTKVHLIPADSRDYASSVADGRSSLGRASMRSSKLSQSFTSEHVSPFNPPYPSPSSGPGPRGGDRKKVLITRLFPVTLPNDDEATATPQSRLSEDSSSYPFPQYDDPKVRKKKPQPKQKRTPMYAVALIISLPSTPSQFSSASGSRDRFRGPSSYTEQDSFPSSFGSTRRSGWTVVGGLEPMEPVYGTDLEDRIDIITQHWDIIMRTLTHLQSVVATKLFALLKQKDILSPGPQPASYSYSSHVSSMHPARPPSVSGRRSEDGSLPPKPPKTNAKIITLEAFLLKEDRQIRLETDIARTRIASGLRATRVITGQNRWGIWREEARWVAKWAGGREQSYFFCSLMTGFLSTHVDWLQALSPAWYRKRHFMQQKSKPEEDTSLPARTIIVSQDKMAARRMVFLLSAFLPANQQLPSLRTHRPSTSASLAAFSHSPPSYVVPPILKEESLRRKINRRPGPRGVSHARNISLQGGPSPRNSGVPPHLAHLSIERGHQRRASDAISVRSANFPVPGSDLVTRKSSAATTTTTVTPEATIPHFSTHPHHHHHHRVGSFSQVLPDNSNSSPSTAADDLKRSLSRGDSTSRYSMDSTDSRAGSRWGSVISGLWGGTRRRDSATMTPHTSQSAGGRDSMPTSSPARRSSRRGEPPSSRVLQDVRALQSPVLGQPAGLGGPVAADSPRTPHPADDGQDHSSEQSTVAEPPERIPDPSGAFESPVKTSINADDGVIEVDVPFPDYITSFETAVSSPSSSGYLSTPGLGNSFDAFEQSCRVAIDGDAPLNVAGWLQHYHPDFTLQAIPPQEDGDLLEQVRASMRAEPSPTLHAPVLPTSSSSSSAMNMADHHPVLERWVDVSTAVVADATTLTVTRLRYSRLVRPKPVIVDQGMTLCSGSLNPYGSSLLTPSITPYEMQLEERWEEETLLTLDDILSEAVERVIAEGSGAGATSTDASKETSAASSRSTSKRRGRSGSHATEPSEEGGGVGHAAASRAQLHMLHPQQQQQQQQEVPRAECKAVVLSSLEELIRDVIDKRDEKSHGTARQVRDTENVLRQAVGKWLESVEMGE